MSLNLLNDHLSTKHKLIDWEPIVSQLVSLCHFASTQELVSSSIRISTLPEIELALDSVSYFLNKLHLGERESIVENIQRVDGQVQVDQWITYIGKGGSLELKELNEVAKIFESFTTLKKFLADWGYNHRLEFNDQASESIKRDFIRKFRQFVAEDGFVDFYKHPTLRELYEKIVSIENFLRTKLQEYPKDNKYGSKLQFTGHDIINDRYVLAIRSDSYTSELGQIIAHSESGMTLYVEPFELKERCNERIKLLAKIEEILAKICREFCLTLSSHLDSLYMAYSYLVQVDLNLVKAQFSVEKNLQRPELTEKPLIKLSGLFHPLIPNPVRNDVVIDLESAGMVISGPNTGGKTALLKALGLCQLFLHFGLYLPIIDGEICPFEGVYYFGNDGQNILEGLSSFSSETKNYLELFDELESKNLILIDEIFNSTSSEEASALAIALFEELNLNSTSKIIVSTHHHFLKTYMHQHKRFISAHVGFDTEKDRPTYKLITGTPGGSLALTIFALLSGSKSTAKKIFLRAKEVLKSESIQYEELLLEVSKKNAELSLLIEKNRALEKQLSNQFKASEGILKLKMQEKMATYEQKLDSILTKAEQLLHKAQEGETSSRGLYKEGHQLKRELLEGDPRSSQMDSNVQTEEAPSHVKLGEMYFYLSLKKNVKIISYDERKKEALVQLGAMTLRAPLESLRVAKGGLTQSKRVDPTVNILKLRDDESRRLEIDCRGERLSDFQVIVDKALTDIYSGEIPFITLIHGHGDGILKNWLRKHLKTHPDLTYEIPELSHDGATKIYLKNN